MQHARAELTSPSAAAMLLAVRRIALWLVNSGSRAAARQSGAQLDSGKIQAGSSSEARPSAVVTSEPAQAARPLCLRCFWTSPFARFDCGSVLFV